MWRTSARTKIDLRKHTIDPKYWGILCRLARLELAKKVQYTSNARLATPRHAHNFKRLKLWRVTKPDVKGGDLMRDFMSVCRRRAWQQKVSCHARRRAWQQKVSCENTILICTWRAQLFIPYSFERLINDCGKHVEILGDFVSARVARTCEKSLVTSMMCDSALPDGRTTSMSKNYRASQNPRSNVAI
jgi:hypothetical protein